MRFTSAVVIALLGAAQASPIVAPEPVMNTAGGIDAPVVEARAILSGGQDVAEIEKRVEPISTTILVAAGSAVATAAVNAAIDGIKGAIKGIANWDKAREEFTKKTTSEMWAKANKQLFSAAVCYNMGYDAPNIDGKTSVQIKRGLLKTTYDCFYMKAGSAVFQAKGDGGFQNLAAAHDSRCTYDRKKVSLTCK